MYTKESLLKLREKIDLIDLLGSHIELKRAGAAFKALCPFHQEKNPSFTIQKGDSHYHCFGCGAHGDAIEFVMNFLNLSFVESVQFLAERYHVVLEEGEKNEKEPKRATLRKACEAAMQFFHGNLLFTEEGAAALDYLYKRELTIDFIHRFEIGLAPQNSQPFFNFMRSSGLSEEDLLDAGLINSKKKPFFLGRICFPIRDSLGNIVGFSGRKYKNEDTFGGKYINTPETLLYKKSKILFGLNYCRKRIAKESRALLVEGQIDCLKLIDAGLNFTVSALGTAFGESHVSELQKLGVRLVYLLFDGDTAGRAACLKVGQLFLKKSIDVKIASFAMNSDPDSFISEHGIEKLIELIDKSEDYLTFALNHLSQEGGSRSLGSKAMLVKELKTQIEDWEDPVMVHEGLKKLASLVRVPEETIGISPSFTFVKKNEKIERLSIDPHRILELDLLRWLILLASSHPGYLETASKHLNEDCFWNAQAKKIFQNIMGSPTHDLLSYVEGLEEPGLIDEILKKKVNKERAKEQFLDTVQKLLDRQWMQTSEQIKMRIHKGNLDEDEIFDLAKKFDELKKERPKAVWMESST